MTKHTQPTDWMTASLGDLVDADAPICYGIVLPGEHHAGGVPIVKVKDMVQGTVRTENLLMTSPEIDEQYRRSRLTGGDILLSIRGTVGRIALVPDALAGANITQDTARLRISCPATRAFVYQILQSEYLQRQIQDHVVGQAVRGINIHSVRRLQIPIPQFLPARSQVANLLGEWDLAIVGIEQLLEAGERRLEALSRRLLSQRFHAGSAQRLINCRADQVFGNISRKGNPTERLLSVTQDRGVIPRDLLPGRVAMPSGALDTFKLVEPGNFVISLRSFQGGIEHSSYRGLVSPAYTVLAPRREISERFFRHYFRSADFIKRLSVAVVGIRDGRQISFQDFGSIKLPLPPLDTQHRVAAILDDAEREIALLNKEAEALRKQKRGLMQQLLTGKRRLAPKDEVQP